MGFNIPQIILDEMAHVNITLIGDEVIYYTAMKFPLNWGDLIKRLGEDPPCVLGLTCKDVITRCKEFHKIGIDPKLLAGIECLCRKAEKFYRSEVRASQLAREIGFRGTTPQPNRRLNPTLEC